MFCLQGNLTSTSILELNHVVMLLRQSFHYLSRVTHRKNITLRLQHFIKFQIHTAVLRSLKQQQHSKETAAWGIRQKKLRSTVHYVVATAVLTVGLSYAAVPLYRMFCQAYSYGGTTGVGHDADKVETMSKVHDRLISVKFNADIAASMRWNFKPQQAEIKVVPGETALAFYTACNPTDVPVTGVSTYNVIPFEAGQYFNKIQCFCFEEQLLNPHEQVDMPVFFYIDPEFTEDPKMETVDTLTLSYTFFEAKPGLKLPVPSFVKP